MADFFNHAITVGDVFMVAGLGVVALIAFLLFVVLAVTDSGREALKTAILKNET